MSHVTQSKSLNLFGFQFDSGNKEFGPNNKKNTFLVYKTLWQVLSHAVILWFYISRVSLPHLNAFKLPKPAWQPCNTVTLFPTVLFVAKVLFKQLNILGGWVFSFPVLTCAHYLPHPLHTLLPGNRPWLVVAIGLRLEQI